MSNQIQISVRKLEKTRHGGPARYQFLVQEAAYRENGSAYPFVVECLECRNNSRSRDVVLAMLTKKYAGRVVAQLDLSPIGAQLF